MVCGSRAGEICPPSSTLEKNLERSKHCDEDRLEAKAIGRILDRQSREVVGWIYEWNTGERGQMWTTSYRDDVVYEEAIDQQ